MTGKQKCAILRQIRRDIAAKNDISITISECKHKGNCLGSCPKCESEVAALEKALELRRKNGKQVVIAGISAGLIVGNCAACRDPFGHYDELEGDIYVSSTSQETETEKLMGDIAETDVQSDEYQASEGLITAPEESNNDE